MPVGLILRCAKPLIVIALIAGLMGYRALLVRERNAARARVQVLEEDKATLVRTNAAMEQALARQNQAIADLNNEAVSRLRAAQAHEAQAATRGSAELEGALAHAAQMAHTSVPDGCGGAIAWGNAQGPELGRW